MNILLKIERARWRMHLDAWGFRGVKISVKNGRQLKLPKEVLAALTPAQKEVLKI